MARIQWNLAIEHLMGLADYRDGSTYEALVRTWRDSRDLPTEQALQDAWAEYEIEQAARTLLETNRAAAQETAETGVAADHSTDFSGLSDADKNTILKVLWLRYLRTK